MSSGEERGYDGQANMEEEVDGGTSQNKRSRTNMEEFRRLRQNGYAFKITFDEEGVPSSTQKGTVAKFSTYCAYLAKARVSILVDDWNKDVAKEQRDELWEDVKSAFNISYNKHKKKVLTMMGRAHRAFRSRLVTDFIDNENPKNAWDIYPFSKKEWDAFFAKKTNTITIPGNSEGVGSTSITIGNLEPRSAQYFMGRAVSTGTEGSYTFNSGDTATIEAFGRSVTLSQEVSSGTIDKREVLSKAVGRPDYSGRTRGAPGWTNQTDLYGRRSRKNVHESCMTPLQITALMDAVTERCKNELKEEVREEMKNEWTQQATQQMTTWFVMNGVQEQVECNLFLHCKDGSRVHVANGFIIPSQRISQQNPMGKGKEPMEKGKGTKEIERAKKVASEVSMINRGELLEPKYLAKLSQAERKLYSVLKFISVGEETIEVRDCDPWGTHENGLFIFNLGDIVECFQRECLNISMIKIYSWYWMIELSKEVGFSKSITIWDPDKLAEITWNANEDSNVSYMKRSFSENPECQYFILPYNQGAYKFYKMEKTGKAVRKANIFSWLRSKRAIQSVDTSQCVP
ncbi:hypothetical protein LUZ61_007104 [Rhynchospora tenuis]|uniref:Uncharacterized protein n=1 Tax=Rhynchospora tenuis TaxID=198213 RepID=A0AAD5ZSR4_9POAL|nr:hypothetical protein LUZ61_007104 [Rhynchospora tenuis]